jgi:hypothetical protein
MKEGYCKKKFSKQTKNKTIAASTFITSVAGGEKRLTKKDTSGSLLTVPTKTYELSDPYEDDDFHNYFKNIDTLKELL